MAKDDKDLTRAEIRSALAKNLKDKVAAASEDLRKLRERELRRTAAPLSKNDLCLMCAQRAKVCKCLAKASAEEVNGEMKGFKSIANSPTFGGGSLTNAPKAAPRAGNGTKAVSGTIQNAKAEPMPKAAPGAVLPTTKKPKKVGMDEGSGGEIQKHGEVPSAAKAVTGVPGKQPVGQGGGDAHKLPAAAKPMAAKPAAASAAMPKVGMHPDTAAGLAAAQSQSPKNGGAWRAGGLPKLRAALAANKAKALPSEDIDVSEFAQKPAAAPPAARAAVGAPAASPSAPKAAARTPAHVPAAMGGAAQLAADKRAGGVGFLNALLSRFRPAAQAAPSTGPARATFGNAPLQSKRVHGAMPLQRNEGALKTFSLGKCAMCRKGEHGGLCKTDPGAPTEGLSSINHNRTMLRVGQSGQRKKTKR